MAALISDVQADYVGHFDAVIAAHGCKL